MEVDEIPSVFVCNGEELLGIAHRPAQYSRRGVLIIVGGPQYRVGSHRQFVQLARHLASAGVAVFRFDYRGMGDSDGYTTAWETGLDIAAAIHEFIGLCPELDELILWGLCDGATASVLFADQDPRVRGLVLVNPWVRTEAGLARTLVKHYYLKRLLDRSFWMKLFLGRLDLFGTLRSLLRNLLTAVTSNRSPATSGDPVTSPEASAVHELNQVEGPSPDWVFQQMRHFGGRVLVILSGKDYVAAEFSDAADSSSEYRSLLRTGQLSINRLDEADHTFSRRQWAEQVSVWTEKWLLAW